MFAIVSDIHGNLEAFTTVLAEIERRGMQHIVCLGDIIGYGPNPMECMDLVMTRCRAALMGNHDFAGLLRAVQFQQRRRAGLLLDAASALRTIPTPTAGPRGGSFWATCRCGSGRRTSSRCTPRRGGR